MFFLARVLGGEVNIHSERILSCSCGSKVVRQNLELKAWFQGSLIPRLFMAIWCRTLPSLLPGHILTDIGGDRLLSATTGGSGPSHISSLLSTMDSLHGEG